MNFSELQRKIENGNLVTYSEVEGVIPRIGEAYDEEAGTERQDEIKNLWDCIRPSIEEGNYIADADDVHNLAVSFSRLDMLDKALFIVEHGLKSYPSNTDLLADALKYSCLLLKFDLAQIYYDRIFTIPKALWTWRAFDFAIDYLTENVASRLDTSLNSDEIAARADQLKQSIRSLVGEFKKFFPSDERSALAEVGMIHNLEDHLGIEREIEALRIATEENPQRPKCLLRYAELLIENGQKDGSLAALKKCELSGGLEANSGISRAYLYYLIASVLFSNLLELLDEDEIIDSDKKQNQISDLVRRFYVSCRSAESVYPPLKIGLLENLANNKRLIEIKTAISEDSM
jgi:tetratricopeptide (TPR) repeat protein